MSRGKWLKAENIEDTRIHMTLFKDSQIITRVIFHQKVLICITVSFETEQSNVKKSQKKMYRNCKRRSSQTRAVKQSTIRTEQSQSKSRKLKTVDDKSKAEQSNSQVNAKKANSQIKQLNVKKSNNWIFCKSNAGKATSEQKNDFKSSLVALTLAKSFFSCLRASP